MNSPMFVLDSGFNNNKKLLIKIVKYIYTLICEKKYISPQITSNNSRKYTSFKNEKSDVQIYKP